MQNIHRRSKRFILFCTALLIVTSCSLIPVLGYYYYRASEYVNESNTLLAEFQGRYIVADDVLGYTLKPDNIFKKITPPEYEYITNDLGARVNKPNLKAPSSVDIVGIGCSFTVGQAVAFEETFIHLAAKRLHKTALNFGVPGYSTLQAYLNLERIFNAGIKPKIIIYTFMPEHTYRTQAQCTGYFWGCKIKPYVDLDENNTPFIHKPIPTPDWYNEAQASVSTIHEVNYTDVLWQMYKDYSILTQNQLFQESIRHSQETLNADSEKKKAILAFAMEKMLRLSEAHGAKLVVVFHPWVHGRYHEKLTIPLELEYAVEKLRKSPNFMFVDPKAAFERIGMSDDYVKLSVPIDTHPSALANEIIAQHIVAALKEKHI